jgi:hypothetical protein
MGNYISSRYSYYFDNQNKYISTIENEEFVNSPLSTQSFDIDCPDMFQNGFLILPKNENILSEKLNNKPVRNLDYLKVRYKDLLIYNSYLKLEYNNCRLDNDELLSKIEKLERQNIYFKQKIYKINTAQNPFKHRRKTV